MLKMLLFDRNTNKYLTGKNKWQKPGQVGQGQKQIIENNKINAY